jgi:cell division protein FtsL
MSRNLIIVLLIALVLSLSAVAVKLHQMHQFQVEQAELKRRADEENQKQYKAIMAPVEEEAPDPALNKSIIDQFMP